MSGFLQFWLLPVAIAFFMLVRVFNCAVVVGLFYVSYLDCLQVFVPAFFIFFSFISASVLCFGPVGTHNSLSTHQCERHRQTPPKIFWPVLRFG